MHRWQTCESGAGACPPEVFEEGGDGGEQKPVVPLGLGRGNLVEQLLHGEGLGDAPALEVLSGPPKSKSLKRQTAAHDSQNDIRSLASSLAEVLLMCYRNELMRTRVG